jgi:formylglycine-generating enzyme required for sulfatase activity
MVYVPTGEFWMGSTDEDIDAVMAECSDCVREEFTREQPRHKVYVDAFWIDRTEVTNAQYRQCVADGACSPPSSLESNLRDSYYDNPEFDNYPVVYVTWYQAQEYAGWAGGRLPTEAEWEYAARGPDGSTYPWGNGAPNDSLLNYDWNVGDTTAVGSYPDGASWCGALDMAGNVWEWVSSSYQDYPYNPDDGRENPDASGKGVHRGGAFAYARDRARGAYRSFDLPDSPWVTLGFRVVVVSPISPSSGL